LICLIPLFFSSQVYSQESSHSFSTLLSQLVDLQDLWKKPDFTVRLWSSYDPAGSNRDGEHFLRTEGKWYVVAEMEGPGAVTRIWSANPKGMIRIHVDDGGAPIVQQSFRDVFLSRAKPFMKPFVRGTHDEDGSHWSYVPIPYARFCKISLSEPCFYQIESITYPPQTNIVSLKLPLSTSDENAFTTVSKQFRLMTEPPFPIDASTQVVNYSVSIPANEMIDFATFDGPAVLKGVQMRWSGNLLEAGRHLLLRCYWDDESEPSVVSPVFDFFGGRTRTYALGTDPAGRHYCYLPMPFQRSARISLENGLDSGALTVEMTCYVSKLPVYSPPLRTFHAFWNRENETCLEPVQFAINPFEPIVNPEQNYIALNTKGRGHVVGITMIRTPSPDSDAMIFVDSDVYPPLFAETGNEGFFDQAWQIQTIDWPLAGGEADLNGQNNMTRLFLPAPIPFENGILLSFEHGLANTNLLDYSTTVFWYQEEPHDPFPWPLPSLARRLRSVPLIQPVLELNSVSDSVPPNSSEDENGAIGSPQPRLEAEEQIVLVSGGIYEPQDMLPYGPDWSANRQLRFEAVGVDSVITFLLSRIRYSGWYSLHCVLTSSPDSPVVIISINDHIFFNSIDLYSVETKPKSLQTAPLFFFHAVDEPRLEIRVQGKNPKSKGHMIGVDWFELIPCERSLKAVNLQGPFATIQDSLYKQPRWMKSVDNDKILLGFKKEEVENAESHEYNAQRSPSGLIHAGERIKDVSLSECFFWVETELEASRSGIYRFEVEPAEMSSFLLLDTPAGTIHTLDKHVLLNSIFLEGDQTVRYDSATGRLLPTRFELPLHEGVNRIGWTIRGHRDTRFIPKIYGLPEKQE
jgi:hypothetical protein